MNQPKRLSSLLHAEHPAVLVALLVLLIGMSLVTHHLYRVLISEPAVEGVKRAATEQAEQLGKLMHQFVDRQQQQLDKMASMPLTTAALDADRSARDNLEANLVALLPNADYLRLIAAEDRDLTQQLNFVALDLARRVMAGEPVEAEAMKHQQRWHILQAVAVGDDSPGCLLMSRPAEQLQRHLQAQASAQGRIKLIQTLGGGRQPFVAAGTGADDSKAVTIATAIPHWTLQLTPSQQLIDSQRAGAEEMTLFYISLGVTLMIAVWAGLRGWLKYRAIVLTREEKVRQQHKQEQEQLAKATSFLATIPSSHVEGEGETDVVDNASSEADDAPEDVFEMPSGETEPEPKTEEPAAPALELPASVFRAYDIRGFSDTEITPCFATQLGLALGALAQQQDQHSIAVGHDGRTSSPALYEALIEGILDTGCNVIALGLAPTPLVNYGLHALDQTSSGVTVTASHNPPEYNGFKITIAGKPLASDGILALREQMANAAPRGAGGERSSVDMNEAYLERIIGDTVPASGLHVVVDAANGAAGPLAVQLLEGLGCRVTPLYCEVDGNFPNHHPDTSIPANLDDLVQVVLHQQADLGIALDGDGDRVVAVSNSGQIVWPDELMMIFARDVLTRQPGADIVFDIKSTRRLSALIGSYGGRPVIWKTGHSYMRDKIAEVNAPLGGEYSGHLFFNDRWYGFDDGIYSAARLVEIISLREQSLDDMLDTLPSCASTTELKLEVPEQQKFALIEQLIASGKFEDAKITTLDGLRVDFANGWGLIRASNTSPALTLRFEGDSPEDLNSIRELMLGELQAAAPDLAVDL